MDLISLFKTDVFWNAFSAIMTAIGAVAILVGVIQLRFDAWLKAQEVWTAREFTDARSALYSRLDAPTQGWTADQKREALNICRKMDEFASLIPYLPKRTALRHFGVPFAKAWSILEPIVTEERRVTKWPGKWLAFEKLGRAALKKHPDFFPVQRNDGAKSPVA